MAKREYDLVCGPNSESNAQSALLDVQELYPEDENSHLADQPKSLYALGSVLGGRNDWYFDSGASDHITEDPSVFSYIKDIILFRVVISNKT